MDKIERENLDEEIKLHAEVQVFLEQKKRLLDGSQLYLALDMAKKICNAHIDVAGSVTPIPAILQMLGVKTGGGEAGGDSAGGGGQMDDLEENGDAIQFRNQSVVHLSSNLSNPASVKENERSNPETACANCNKISISTLHLAGNPFGTSSVKDFWRICDECLAEYK